MPGMKGEEFRRTGNVVVNQFMDKQCEVNVIPFLNESEAGQVAELDERRGAAAKGCGRGEGKQNNAREMVALVFLVSFLLAAQDHRVCWLNQCQPNKCYE